MSAPLPSSSRKLSLTSSHAYDHFKGSPEKKEACFKDAFKRYKEKSFAECLKLVSTNPDNEPLFLRDDSLFSAFGPKIPKSAQLFLATVYLNETKGQFNFGEFKAKIEDSEYPHIAPELKKSYFENIHTFVDNHHMHFKGDTAKKEACFKDAFKRYKEKSFDECLKLVSTNPDNEPLFLRDDSLFSAMGPKVSKSAQLFLATMYLNETKGQFNFEEFKAHIEDSEYAHIKPELKKSYFENIHIFADNHHHLFSNAALKYVYNYPIAKGSYTGQMVDGKAQGHGTMYFANGAIFVGQFKDGAADGHGIFTYSNGNKFVGQVKDQSKNGYGTYTLADGGKYIGKYKKDRGVEYGIIISALGYKHVGQVENGHLDGYGTEYDKNGVVIKTGVWIRGGFLQAAAIPESVNATIVSLARNIHAVNAACKKAKAQAKVAYLKAQNARYRPHYFPKIQSENEQGQATTALLPNVITGLIGEYAAPDFIGDGKGWNIEDKRMKK